MRRIDCVYPRPSFSARDACYARLCGGWGYEEGKRAGDYRKHKASVPHEKGDFGAVSVKERSCASSILKVGRHISDTRFLYHSFPQCEQVFTTQISRIELQ